MARKSNHSATPNRRQPPRAAKNTASTPTLNSSRAKRQRLSKGMSDDLRGKAKATASRKNYGRSSKLTITIESVNVYSDKKETKQGRTTLDICPNSIPPKLTSFPNDIAHLKERVTRKSFVVAESAKIPREVEQHTLPKVTIQCGQHIPPRAPPQGPFIDAGTSWTGQSDITPVLSHDFKSDIPSEEELQIAKAFARIQIGRGIPWDFQVPYGYEEIVKVSGRPPDVEVDIKCMEWKSYMRFQEWAATAQQVHEVVHGPLTPVLSSTPSPVTATPQRERHLEELRVHRPASTKEFVIRDAQFHETAW